MACCHHRKSCISQFAPEGRVSNLILLARYKNAMVYRLSVAAYMDANGDGFGDLTPSSIPKPIRKNARPFNGAGHSIHGFELSCVRVAELERDASSCRVPGVPLSCAAWRGCTLP